MRITLTVVGPPGNARDILVEGDETTTVAALATALDLAAALTDRAPDPA